MVETITTQHNMLIYTCSCGKQILIIPDLCEMGKAISNHVIEHNKLKTKKQITEEKLTQEIINVIAEKQWPEC